MNSIDEDSISSTHCGPASPVSQEGYQYEGSGVLFCLCCIVCIASLHSAIVTNIFCLLQFLSTFTGLWELWKVVVLSD
jgi:hypothetical protein